MSGKFNEKRTLDGVGLRIGPMRIPTSEEWDKLMDVVREEDSVAHWNKMFSWVNDTQRFDEASSLRAYRGYNSARLWHYYPATYRRASVGFRPAFEILGNNTLAPDIQDGDAVVAGTLYMNGVPVRVPQKPTSDGDIEDYIPGAKLEIRPSLDDPAYQLTAIKAGNILVADRNLLKRISYLGIEEALKPRNDELGTKQEKDGICPICGAEVDFDGDHEIQDDSTVVPWVCPKCGAEGKQWHDIRFSYHTGLADKDGNEPEETDEESGDGICPICGAELEFNGDQEIVDDTTQVTWSCPTCKSTGTQVSDIVFSEHLDVISPTTGSGIRRKAYERYKLAWMLAAGYTLSDLIKELTEYAITEEDDEGVGIQQLFSDWEYESGFHGALYACLDEFLEAEYLDAEYMKPLLDDSECAEYLKDVAALQAEE